MLRAASALAVAALLLVATAYAKTQNATSHPPAPSSGKVANPNQQKPATQNQPASDDKRGTQAAPLVVEVLNPPNGDAIAAEIKKNREDQAAEDRRSLIFNSLLVGVGILQAVALIFTVVVTNKGTNAAKKAAQAAWAGVTPLISYAGAELVPTWPPPTKEEVVPLFGGIPPKKCWARLAVVNSGGGAAIVTKLHMDYRVVKELPPIPSYGEAAGLQTVIGANQFVGIVIDDAPIELSAEQRDRIGAGDERLWIYGFLTFRDGSGLIIRDVGYVGYWDTQQKAMTGARMGFVLQGPPAYNFTRESKT